MGLRPTVIIYALRAPPAKLVFQWSKAPPTTVSWRFFIYYICATRSRLYCFYHTLGVPRPQPLRKGGLCGFILIFISIVLLQWSFAPYTILSCRFSLLYFIHRFSRFFYFFQHAIYPASRRPSASPRFAWTPNVRWG